MGVTDPLQRHERCAVNRTIEGPFPWAKPVPSDGTRRAKALLVRLVKTPFRAWTGALLSVLWAAPASAQEPAKAEAPAQPDVTTKAEAPAKAEEPTKSDGALQPGTSEGAVAPLAPREPAPPPWVVNARTADAALAAKRYKEAAHHYTLAFLGATAARAPDQQVARLNNAVRHARSFVVALQISTKDGASVSVDGVSVGTAPLRGEILVDPGPHRISVREPSCSGEDSIETSAGQARSVSVGCHTYPRWRIPMIIGGGVVSAVAIGVGAAASDAVAERSVEISNEARFASRLGGASTTAREKVRQLEDERAAWTTGALVGFVLGAAALAGTAVFYFKVPARPTPEVQLGVSAGPAGFALRGTW